MWKELFLDIASFQMYNIKILSVLFSDLCIYWPGVQDLPAIGLFRNGQFVQYEGDETSEKQILAWLTDEETLKIIGVIDEVSPCQGPCCLLPRAL